MFGKIIQLKRRSSCSVKEGGLPDPLSHQFNSEAVEKSVRLAPASRISHINFGRESYFGLVTHGDDKGVNVHVSLDPETKTLTRASCGCFRSNTRSYCHHIVSFVRYILRSDPQSSRLRTLGEDFTESFWYEISWFAYRNFSDSPMGFQAQINHADDAIRISFSDRNNQEILSFMPGPRLIDEFLHEFFEIIRRDIDPSVFRRLYGRKLKDPNVPSLRRRPWEYSESEDEINRRGIKSIRQHFEDSLWYKIAKVGYLIGGRCGGEFGFRFMEHKQELIIELADDDDNLIMRFTPPRSHIGAIIEAGERKDVIGYDLYMNPQLLNAGYEINLEEDSSLVIIPVVQDPESADEQQPLYLDRTELESQQYGSYYYFPEGGFYRIAAGVTGLPPEIFSPCKKTVIAPENITGFLQEYGEALQTEPFVFMDPSLLGRKTVQAYDKALMEHQEVADDSYKIGLTYTYNDSSVTFKEVYTARRHGSRFLISGDKWIDIQTPEFAWMEDLSEDSLNDDGTLRIKRSDYIKISAFHEKLEKKFVSSKVKSHFHDLENLKSPGRLPSLRAMKGKLRQYQKNGLGWLWFLYENGFSGLLCDDMGLGKTHQVMALITGILHRRTQEADDLKFLVICPTSVLSHWHDKLMEYCPHVDPYLYHGTDRDFTEAFDNHRLIITSYGIALRDVDMLAQYNYEVMVLDEAQSLKNKATKTYSAVKTLSARCSIGLTGTPIENSVTDLKSLFDVILPGYLMSDAAFEDSFRIPIEECGEQDSRDRLAKIIRPFTLRRKKEQVLTELPAKIEDVRHCSLSEDQISFYKDIVNNRGENLIASLKDTNEKVQYMHIFAVLNYLKQVCNHPALLVGEPTDYNRYASGKWDLFVELLEESLGSGQKVVVFSQYVKMLDLIESYLRDKAIGYAAIRGTTRNRGEVIKRFNSDPDCMVFSASLRASGLGIDLTAASVVIHYDRWWNSAREEQATDRVHRIGQNRGVQVFKLITKNTLEEKIDTLISKKRKLMESVVKQDDQGLLKRFSRDELIQLISY